MIPEPLFIGRTLSLGYGRRVLIRNLSFEVHRGHILGIVGPNGSGKTTLLRTLLGLQKPLEGTLERREGLNIGYMPQRERIDTILPITALEVVLMGRTAKARAFQRVRRKDHDAAHRSLARVGVESLSDQLFRNLSGGQQQRVLLARTLAADPEVLVLDEPTAGMDVASEAATIEFLRALNRDHRVTIAIVSHRLSLVVNLADCVMLIGNQSALFGSLDEVVQEGPLSELYGVPVHVGTVAGKTTLVVGLPGADNV